MIKIRRFLHWDEVAVYRDAWNELVVAHAGNDIRGVPSLFQTFEWNQAWWQALGSLKYELLLLGAFEDDLLTGVAPLMIGRRGLPFPGKIIYFLGADPGFDSDYCSFILKDEREDVLNAFLEWFNINPDCWDELVLRNIPENALDIPALQKQYSGRSKLSYLADAPVRFLGGVEEDNDLLTRKNLNRKFNWFKNHGELTYRHWDLAEDIHPRLQGLFEQHICRWSKTSTPSKFNDSRYTTFYHTLVDLMVPEGWLRFFTVDFNGETFAYLFGFELSGKFYFYTPSSDIFQLKKRTTGDVLLKILFEYAVDRKLKEFDFLGGNEEYKYRFANGVRRLYAFHVFRSRQRAVLFNVLMSCRTFICRVYRLFCKKFRLL